jgi:hypothetical protein
MRALVVSLVVCLFVSFVPGCGGGETTPDGGPRPDADGASVDRTPDGTDAVEAGGADHPVDAAPGDTGPGDAVDGAPPDAPVESVGDVPTEAAVDVADATVDSKDAAGDGVVEAPAPVCGDRIIETGEQCDIGVNKVFGTKGEFCRDCRTTCLGSCPWNHTPDTCAPLSGDDRLSCLALLDCMAYNLSFCVYVFQPGVTVPGPSNCYCSDSTCSKGADGMCAAEFNAVAKTTDPNEVLLQLADPTSTVAGVAAMAKRYGSSSLCPIGCQGQP